MQIIVKFFLIDLFKIPTENPKYLILFVRITN